MTSTLPVLSLHRGPYLLCGRRSMRAEWKTRGELALEIENDVGVRTMILSPKQIDRLVVFLLTPYIAGAEEVIPVGKSGKGKGNGKGSGKGRC